MIRHHPDESLLLGYAGGAVDEATGLVVATHLAFCAVCRGSIAKMEAVGGSLLQELAPAPMSDTALDVAMGKLDTAGIFERPPRAHSSDGTPEVLRRYLGGDLAQARWRRMGPQFSQLPLFRRGPVTARLLRAAAGAEAGPHRHHGLEYILVLKGGFQDVTGRYGPGDLQVMEGAMHHNPVADPGEDCVNLAVTTGRLKFDSPILRLFAPLFGF
jgi:putative transcriptional regulator